MLTVEQQVEGLGNVRNLNKKTNHWGFVQTPYGRMFLGGNDDGIAVRYFHGYVYEPVSMALWTRASAGAKLAVDVGAHTGIYTLAAYKAGAQRVISVEPYFVNAARLIMNLHVNTRPMHDVVTHAASDRDGAAELMVTVARGAEHYCTAASNLTHHANLERRQLVRLSRLDSFITDRVDVMKIDAEYHTGAIIDGAAELLKAKPDLIFESYETGLTERLAPMGYRFWLIDERDGLRPARTVEPQAKDEFKRNYFASIREAPEDLLA